MKSKTQKYFESMLFKAFPNTPPTIQATNQSNLHNMSVREQDYQSQTFEERVYLENEAFSHFCDFLNKE